VPAEGERHQPSDTLTHVWAGYKYFDLIFWTAFSSSLKLCTHVNFFLKESVAFTENIDTEVAKAF